MRRDVVDAVMRAHGTVRYVVTFVAFVRGPESLCGRCLENVAVRLPPTGNLCAS